MSYVAGDHSTTAQRNASPVCAMMHEESRTMTIELSMREPLLAAIPRMRAFALSLCRNPDEAEDLVQEALLRACVKIRLFEPGSDMDAWLCTILKNQFYSECRRRRTESRRIDELKAMTETISPPQMPALEYNELCAALARLKPKQREAFIMVAASGFSYGEAASLSGCPIGTVKCRVNRARAELARLLSVEGPEYFEADPIFSAAIPSGYRVSVPG